MTTTRRMKGVEVRALTLPDGTPGVVLQAIAPGVVDDYGSLWEPHAFDDSLATRLPTLCWSHDWSEPLGPGVDYETSDDGPRVSFRFSDFDAVPQARRAHAQVTDGTIQDCSVGFSQVQRRSPTDAEEKQFPGIREVIEQATLDEISLVLRGAVPGAKVLSVRTAAGVVEESLVLDLARKVTAGEITKDEALVALDLAAGGTPTEEQEQEEQETDELDEAALIAEADAALDQALGYT
jgi:HK97 family phage prohead protease